MNMNLICGALKNLWLEFYTKYVKNLDDKTKVRVGGILIVLSLFVFVLSTKGHSKSDIVNNWFLFWVSICLFFGGVYYLMWA